MNCLDVPLQKLLVVEGLSASLAFPSSEVVVADLVLGEFVLVLVAGEETIRNHFAFKLGKLTIYCKCGTEAGQMVPESREF